MNYLLTCVIVNNLFSWFKMCVLYVHFIFVMWLFVFMSVLFINVSLFSFCLFAFVYLCS